MTDQPRRNRIVSACMIPIIAWLGISSRRYAESLPDFVAAYAGDTLWALAVFAAIGLVFRFAPTWQVAALAFVISALVELSQLYHAPWIDAIRGTALGALTLGNEFVASDMACYAVGVFLGMLIEFLILD
jgi:hypothetical protein